MSFNLNFGIGLDNERVSYELVTIHSVFVCVSVYITTVYILIFQYLWKCISLIIYLYTVYRGG